MCGIPNTEHSDVTQFGANMRNDIHIDSLELTVTGCITPMSDDGSMYVAAYQFRSSHRNSLISHHPTYELVDVR